MNILGRLWTWAGHFSTVITYWQIGWSMFGGSTIGVWAAQYMPPPVSATVGLVACAAILVITENLTRRRAAAASARMTNLRELRATGISLLNERLFSADDVPEWEARVDQWKGVVVAEVERQFGKTSAQMVEQLGGVSAGAFAGSVNDNHNHKKLMLAERVQRIGRLLGEAERGNRRTG